MMPGEFILCMRNYCVDLRVTVQDNMINDDGVNVGDQRVREEIP